MVLFDADVRLHLSFDAAALDESLALWFVRTGADVDAMPCNAVAFCGTDLSELGECQQFFASFPGVFLAIADDEMRGTLADALDKYCPRTRIFLPRPGAFKGRASVAEIIKDAGESAGTALDDLVGGARERPVYGLLDIAEIKRPERSKPGVLSGFAELDKELGGFSGGELSVWTGKRGEGKSTLLSQLLIESVDQGHRVCAFSGELDAWRFKSWALLQAAGRRNIAQEVSLYSGKAYFAPTAQASAGIDRWWAGNLFLYDNAISGATDEAKILRVFEMAHLRYGCDVFLVDNLMTARFDVAGEDYYRAQGEFVGRLVDFAKRNDVHVHLVAHPRKFGEGRAISADDVGGTSAITDRADNVFSLARVPADEAERAGCDCVLSVLKNRSFGYSGKFRLDFDTVSRRFYRPGSNGADKRYGWEASPEQTAFSEIAADEAAPF